MRDGFVSGKAAVAEHNRFMVKAANAAWRKSSRKDCLISIEDQYYRSISMVSVLFTLSRAVWARASSSAAASAAALAFSTS